MSYSLTPQLLRFVSDLLKSGRFANRSEVVRAGLRLLQDQEDQRKEALTDPARIASLRRFPKVTAALRKAAKRQPDPTAAESAQEQKPTRIKTPKTTDGRFATVTRKLEERFPVPKDRRFRNEVKQILERKYPLEANEEEELATLVQKERDGEKLYLLQLARLHNLKERAIRHGLRNVNLANRV